MCEHATDQLGHASGQLDTGGSTAGDHDVDQPVLDQLRPGVGLLEAVEHLGPHRQCIPQRFQTKGVLGHAGDTERVAHRTGGEHQMVVGQRRAVGQVEPVFVEIAPDHPAHAHRRWPGGERCPAWRR